CARSREETRPRSTRSLSSLTFIGCEPGHGLAFHRWPAGCTQEVPAPGAVQCVEASLDESLTSVQRRFSTNISTNVLKTSARELPDDSRRKPKSRPNERL